MKFEIDDKTGMVNTEDFGEYWNSETDGLEAIEQAVKKTKELLDSKNYIKPVVMEIDRKIKQNQKIVDGILSLLAEERKEASETLPEDMKGVCVMYWMDIVESRIKEATGKDIKDLL